ncbi:MAG: hypothetical protein FD165_2767 [Gammaproteobacteria bacterium]|nr:MAG: hypothetical protein FD165_2767 [Gammaproteobacteria bacterium]
MKAKPNIETFLAGGAAAATEQPKSAKAPAPVAVIPEQRRTKSIRIAPALDMFLKEEAFKRTMASGKRVNESDLIEEALTDYFKQRQ